VHLLRGPLVHPLAEMKIWPRAVSETRPGCASGVRIKRNGARQVPTTKASEGGLAPSQRSSDVPREDGPGGKEG
jgi:hypothetical protein